MPNSYIVVLKPTTRAAIELIAEDIERFVGGKLVTNLGKRAIFKNALQGFGVEMSDEMARAVAADPRVDFVEENAYVELSGAQSFTDADPHYNLDRIDQRWTVASGFRSYQWQSTGANVHAYVLDTGVVRNHIEFDDDNDPNTPQYQPRVRDGVNFSDDNLPASNPCGGFSNDYFAGTHGTAVASVLGGKTVGVAKDVAIVPIKVANCSGAIGQLVWMCWGMDWIVGPDNPNPIPTATPSRPFRALGPAVANISLFIRTDVASSDPTPIGSFEHTVNNVLGAGIQVFVSANNQARSDCETSPARMAYGNSAGFGSPYRTVSVGGTDETDALWRCNVNIPGECNVQFPGGPISDPGSNTGPCVDLYAPVHNLKVAWINGYSSYRVAPGQRSGTSFAAPAAAGVGARILQNNSSLSPSQLWDQIKLNATALPSNFDGDSVNDNDRLLYLSPGQ
ncbi:MAG TPA: S8 family serine peptidase [Thermoanaerobaculia bacterium]|nr:S8 family serine peptidase [Thermoanaerobaculia bacterium]